MGLSYTVGPEMNQPTNGTGPRGALSGASSDQGLAGLGGLPEQGESPTPTPPTMTTPLNVIVVEDHDMLRNATVEFLRNNGHNAVGVFCAEEIIDSWHDMVPDIYIIDLNLPGEDGLSLSARIRQGYPNAGIIVTTARSSIKDRVAGYQNGVDAYLTKPVAREEMIAILHSLGQRIIKAQAAAYASLQLDIRTGVLAGAYRSVRLSHSEANLLSKFIIAPAQTLERWEAMEILGANRSEITVSSLEVRIGVLRKKICETIGVEVAIKPIRGFGFKLCVPIKLA